MSAANSNAFLAPRFPPFCHDPPCYRLQECTSSMFSDISCFPAIYKDLCAFDLCQSHRYSVASHDRNAHTACPLLYFYCGIHRMSCPFLNAHNGQLFASYLSRQSSGPNLPIYNLFAGMDTQRFNHRGNLQSQPGSPPTVAPTAAYPFFPLHTA
jgi:hypothetical protein